MAFAICGLAYYCKDDPNQEAMYLIKTLADKFAEVEGGDHVGI